jgi:hypothetical protein
MPREGVDNVSENAARLKTGIGARQATRNASCKLFPDNTLRIAMPCGRIVRPVRTGLSLGVLAFE